MLDSVEEQFVEEKSPVSRKLIAAIAALAVTVAVFGGYTYLRQRHAEDKATLANSSQGATAEPGKPPQALILVDDAMIKSGKSLIGGTVRNTSAERLSELQVELELKRRKDASFETRLVALQPSQLEPGQDGRYSLELKSQDYSSARLVALRGPANVAIPYTTSQGQKRPPERLESKTINIDRPFSSKKGEFLNSPDNPARVP